MQKGEKIGQGVLDSRLALVLDCFSKKRVGIYTNANVLKITYIRVAIKKMVINLC